MGEWETGRLHMDDDWIAEWVNRRVDCRWKVVDRWMG